MLSYETYQAAVDEIANKVDHLLVDTTVRARFRDHIDRLCKMVEDYGQALQSYAKKLREAEIPWKQTKSPLPLSEFCPPPAGWVEITYPYRDKQFIKGGSSVTHRPKEPVNPLLWFGTFGDPCPQREPTEDEKLMCEYVLLGLIHDYELQQPTNSRVFSGKYAGKWFDRDNFRLETGGYYLYPNKEATLLCHSATAQEKLSHLNRTLDHVQADLASKPPEQKPIEASGGKADLPNEKPVEAEQKAAINVNISGDVKAENLQIGHDSSIHRQTGTQQKNKGILKKSLKIGGAIIVSIVAAVVTDILGDFGLIEGIKAFIYRIIGK